MLKCARATKLQIRNDRAPCTAPSIATVYRTNDAVTFGVVLCCVVLLLLYSNVNCFHSTNDRIIIIFFCIFFIAIGN